ncbi:MAG TPA: DUF2254 domain-containing protein [Jiangellales bacterium]|nr:DUF2254 domain-containing protein [Jiangellales bacterium]
MSFLQRLREQFWFVPAVLCLVGFLVAEALIALEESLDDSTAPGWVGTVLYRVGESGSRDVLSAIATSSLAVAGTTFSITIAVLALTSSSYGPRLVRNFMADRGNQVVLGVYVATFLYSLLVLRSIRVIGDPGAQDAEVFVPHLAVNLAVLLAVANVAVLVYFIHHISDSIQIWTIASGVRTQLRATVDRLYPEQIGRDVEQTGQDGAGLPTQLEADGVPVTASRPGYVQFVDDDKLMSAARRHDVLVALRVRPGQYVLDDTILALAYPPERVHDALAKAVRAACKVADARSPYQDVEFAVQQLSEMAVRALSPGTNDPNTAVNALDDLSAGLAPLASREPPSPARFDSDGRLRVHAPGPDVVGLVSAVIDTMRWYAASAPSVMHATLVLVARVGRHTGDQVLRARLVTQVDLLRDAFAVAGHHRHDVEAFSEHAADVRHGLLRA